MQTVNLKSVCYQNTCYQSEYCQSNHYQVFDSKAPGLFFAKDLKIISVCDQNTYYQSEYCQIGPQKRRMSPKNPIAN